MVPANSAEPPRPEQREQPEQPEHRVEALVPLPAQLRSPLRTGRKAPAEALPVCDVERASRGHHHTCAGMRCRCLPSALRHLQGRLLLKSFDDDER